MSAVTSPKTLQEAIVYFADPAVSLAEMVRLRWADGVVKCPTCGSEKVSFLKARRVWECATQHPKRQFSVKVGTVMEDSAIRLDKWLVAMWLIANAKNGISSYELARSIGVTQKSAWFMLHRIRLAMQDDDGGKLSGRVEVDETYIGGKARNMHPAKRERVIGDKRGGWAGKAAVLGMLERQRSFALEGPSARCEVLASRRTHAHIEANVEPLTRVYTDALPSYEKMPDQFFHAMVDHAEKYVDGQVHTNGLENFWSLLKRSIRGTYVSVEPFHLFRCLDEQAFRFNTREPSDAGRFAITAAAVVGKRLTFNQLTAADQTC